MKSYIKKNLIYSPDARKKLITGDVLVRFVVRKDGSIRNAQIMRGVYSDLNSESLRMVGNMPKWNPAKIGDHPVNSYVNLTLTFQ